VCPRVIVRCAAGNCQRLSPTREIGHALSGTFENFDTYSAFVTQLQTELNGNVLATGVTAVGQYTSSTYTFSASSITLFLNN
jgi:hypothetical protein